MPKNWSKSISYCFLRTIKEELPRSPVLPLGLFFQHSSPSTVEVVTFVVVIRGSDHKVDLQLSHHEVSSMSLVAYDAQGQIVLLEA